MTLVQQNQKHKHTKMFRFEHGNQNELFIYNQVSLSALIINNRLYVENCIVFLSDGNPHILVNLGVSCLSDDTNDPPRLWFRLLDLAMYLSQQHSTASDLDSPFFLEWFKKTDDIK